MIAQLISFFGLAQLLHSQSSETSYSEDFNLLEDNLKNLAHLDSLTLGGMEESNKTWILNYDRIPVSENGPHQLFNIALATQSLDRNRWRECSYAIHTKSGRSDYHHLTLEEHAAEGQEMMVFFGQISNSNPEAISLKLIWEGDRDLEYLGLNLYSPSGPIEAKASAVTIRESCSCPAPDLVLRKDWGCPQEEDCPVWVPHQMDSVNHLISPVTHLIIHHAAGFGVPPYPMQVKSIWNLHVNVNRWDDIGYNWIIDPDGNIYKGRAWNQGSDEVRGAHTCACNSNKMGICLLGNFTDSIPTEEALESLIKLTGWKACELNIEIGTAPVTNTKRYNEPQCSPSCSYSCFIRLPCVDQSLESVSGHRDACRDAGSACTACPGNQFYPMLEWLRLETQKYLDDCDLPTSVEHTKEWFVELFPNPVSDLLFVQSDLAIEYIAIYNLFGEFVMVPPRKSKEILDLSQLNSGIYLINFQAGDFQKTYKFIKI